jgi:hypothetical protein
MDEQDSSPKIDMSEEEKQEMLDILGSSKETKDQLKVRIIKTIDSRWEKIYLSSSMNMLNRQFNRTAKRFGGLKEVLRELINEQQVYAVKSETGAIVFLSKTQHDVVMEAMRLDPNCEALSNAANAYK